MVEEVGIVTKISGMTAKVLVQKRGACEGCTAKGSCETTEEGMEIEALNPVHAREGQSVRVSLKPQAYLKGSMLVYGLPLVVFIAAAIIGKNIGEEYFKDIKSDTVAAITGFAALILSLTGVKVWSKKLESKSEYKPVIEEIIN